MGYESLGGKLKIIRLFLCLFLTGVLRADTQVFDSLEATSTILDTIACAEQDNRPRLLMGDISYADEVILYDPGAPGDSTGDEPDKNFQKASRACGPLEWPQTDSGFVSLGRRGLLVLKFEDNLLFDGPGPDLCIYQGNGSADTMMVWISKDGKYYSPLGQFHQHIETIDIHSVAQVDAGYPFVKIRDHSQRPDSEPASGVDIDAVSAITTAKVIILNASILFESDNPKLKDGATAILDSIADTIQPFPDSDIRIEAFSEQQGAEDYNLMLTQQQAGAIQVYLMTRLSYDNFRYSVFGWGSQKPQIGSHSTATHTGARVELYIRRKTPIK